MKERLTWDANSRRRMIMVQTVDVIAIFDKMIREPKPVRFKIYDSGHWKSVNVERILNIEWRIKR